MRRALIKNNIVDNVIELEDDAIYAPPENTVLLSSLLSENAAIGDLWDGEALVRPTEVPADSAPSIEDRLSALEDAVASGDNTLIVSRVELSGRSTLNKAALG